MGRQVIALMQKLEEEDNVRWAYVPSDPAGVPAFVPHEKNLGEEAEADESWAYDEKGIPCFSLCIPVERERAPERRRSDIQKRIRPGLYLRPGAPSSGRPCGAGRRDPGGL